MNSRVFLVPRFDHSKAVCRAQHCRLLHAGNLVVVYESPDPSFVVKNSSSSMERLPNQCLPSPQQSALLISEVIENDVLDRVEGLLGPVEDVDFNQRLTIVLTELDSLSIHNFDHVQGCVRSSDILNGDPESGGEIIYLDRNLPERTELTALLAHELTHVAVYSSLLRHRLACLESGEGDPLPSENMPAWLNEAIAHAVEYSIAGESANFRWRRRALCAQPEQCPIVTDSCRMTFAARRGGSRAAATLFLNSQSSRTADLRKLLDFRKNPFERIASLSGCPFEEAFRDWTQLLLASSSRKGGQSEQYDLALQTVCIDNVGHGQEKEYALSGTAVRLFTVADDVRELTLTTSADAAIQISVVLP